MSNGETKTCKFCKEEINKKAKRCPKCGAKFGMPGFVKFLIGLFVIFILIIIGISSCANSLSNAIDESVDELENSYKDVSGKTSFNVNETFENAYIKMKITEVNLDFKDYEYASIKDNHKVVMAKVEVENIGEDDQFISYYDYNCYVDGEAMEQQYYLNDNYEDISSTLSSGKKASGYLFFEVSKDATEIIVEYDASWLDSHNIEFVIK